MTPPATATPAIAADQAPRPESMEELSASSEDKLNKSPLGIPSPNHQHPKKFLTIFFVRENKHKLSAFKATAIKQRTA